ncbi:sulfite exporter TauE/SafE family protein [Endozoicomonas gorgoniicola]|uniref:Probable membrane transporter protein n=1 Tax=Endozoicomonas gorgoniicola TaxID=1234144 RepID=A0ABT3N4F3_9GAMM|nr:sulfite exporter TauE/SafE family protein [Endozoicomonas gorgoniicola]MCW7556079.1 sulfite exporter TauE/SafE family protein [Endozoicomonas gorgoniicola]
MDFGVPLLPFLLAAVPAVLIAAVGKGGLGNAMGVMAVPLMSLVIPPIQAAAILLPLLLIMDLFAIWGWRGFVDWNILKVIMLPGLMGVGLGLLIFYQLPENAVRFLIGSIAILFCFHQFFSKGTAPDKPSRLKGVFWATVSGFTSFGVHAGGAPLSVYMLPLKLDKKVLSGTMAIFFGVVNLSKIPAYGGLGELGVDNLILSAILLPLCPLGVFAGMKLVHRIREDIFYKVLYTGLLITGAKLIMDAL